MDLDAVVKEGQRDTFLGYAEEEGGADIVSWKAICGVEQTYWEFRREGDRLAEEAMKKLLSEQW